MNSEPLTLGRLGFGGAGIGNLYKAIPDGEALATVLAAWDSGVRYFDTAPHYGLGLSEQRLGAVLRDKPREEFVISTKVGRLLEANPHAGSATDGSATAGPAAAGSAKDDEGFDVPATSRRVWDFTEAGIRRSIEDSLERLGLDHVDIAYLHDPDVHDLQKGISHALPALEKLRAEGLVKAIGVGTNSAEAALECVEAADLDLIMLAGRYTLLEQPSAPLLERCVEHRTGVVDVGVYNSGLLARPEVPDDAHYNYDRAPRAVVERARALAAVCRDFGVELPTAALQFPLRHPAVVNVTVGASRPEQVTSNASRMQESVPEELWDALEALRRD
ncbi:oxidoreductase aryl-alcohol dehydrogenase like protein [Arthrobacter sp. StoSoilA2]|uniref:aldo/keto reductase n=1 Tax=unclassified Arthrobacter TaxID=235627 RepID=UPI001CC49721|nr:MULTISPECIES: aldo/keto reductase [unclassified Arthrobacter]MDR6686229.1 D-threo-aldose 1-dehydrogenase [Arthrobacter sp. 1088]BCW38015.1 oxidoreductase aryl-alcohol dehydrogenase like protein [Arthrobacter sp. StoSoilA2]